MKRNCILAALAILAVLPLASSYKVNKRMGDRLLVMSYNVRNSLAKDGDNDWEHRKSATKAMLDAVNPDVFGVQEAYENQVNYITENCPRYASFGVGRDNGYGKGERMAILYNTEAIEMIEGGTYWLSETPDEPSFGWDAACRRTATWALLRDRDADRFFYFVNTHLDHKGVEARRNGLALIVNKIGEMNEEGYPMILTGDFNVTPDDSCLVDLDKIMKSARVYAEKTTNKASFNGWNTIERGLVIDYIYYSNFTGCKNFEVLDQPYDNIPFISDHYPVVSTLVY